MRQLLLNSERGQAEVRGREAGTESQRKDAGGRTESEQSPNHPQPKPSSVRSVIGSRHQELDSEATNGRTRDDPQPSQLLVCEPSLIISIITVYFAAATAVVAVCT